MGKRPREELSGYENAEKRNKVCFVTVVFDCPHGAMVNLIHKTDPSET